MRLTPTCSKCGETIAPDDAYCTSCGYRVAIPQRRSLRLTPMLGIYIISLGVLLIPVYMYIWESLLSMTSEQLESTYARNLIAISSDLKFKIIPILLTSGTALLVFAKLKTRSAAFASIFMFGIWGYTLSSQYLSRIIMAEELNAILFNTLFSFLHVSAGLAITSILSYPLARHEWRLTKKRMGTEMAAYFIVGSLILAPIAYSETVSIRVGEF